MKETKALKDDLLDIDSPHAWQTIIEQSIEGNPSAQKKIYQSFYTYSMSICLRYATSKAEAQEIMNDGFLKVFRNLHTYDHSKPFKMWIRRIMINTAIDYFRKRKEDIFSLDVQEVRYVHSHEATGLDNISAEEILEMVQNLTPACRIVFNLYVIEGYNHKEIAEKLGISEGTSKSNLAKARQKLQAMLAKAANGQNYKRISDE
ncbi:MAG: sigma-70 family RNA polymerase sigma factor [Microscillaceae bacterium]|nr:sigma-70 family RNA polymerase sigma factor [Microscillaceae bacterium]MDW8461481.1 sigma-70 family RNA polymerase sigma factor [Cytophagales bacterium]